jgi:glutathione-regulated potassium-efflux system ancillary protein KefC
VRLRLPELTILARARNVTHYYELMKRGVTLIERETFAAALLLGEQTLQQVGFSAERAQRAAGIFGRHNLKTLLEVAPHFQDQQKVMSLTRQAREELEDMFESDAAAFAAAEVENGRSD